VAEIHVRNDSPIIRELNRASQRLFVYLLIFAGVLFLTLAVSLMAWVQRPLHRVMEGLESGKPEALVPLLDAPNEFGKLAQLILQFRHTQEALEEAKERLRHSQKLEAVGRLAGGVAHDFNNLLTAIIGYSELLEARLSGNEDCVEHAQLIRKAGEQAAALTRQLLAFSRKQLLQPKVLDLNALILEMHKLLQRVIGEHIRISYRNPDGRGSRARRPESNRASGAQSRSQCARRHADRRNADDHDLCAGSRRRACWRRRTRGRTGNA
jgi:signal transduction histidine kinase